MVEDYSKSIKLTTLSPYRPGAFEYEFLLADSLKLKLDQSYSVTLRKKEYKEYISEYFKYEDYELSQINLEVRTEEDVQYKGSELKVFVKGTDENDLNLLDARLEVTVTSGEALQFFKDAVFIKDTLLVKTQKLEQEGETIISLPDSIFPAANLLYNLSVTMKTSDNQIRNQTNTIHYFHKKTEIIPEVAADSMTLVYKVDGIEEKLDAEVLGIDRFNNESSLGHYTLPVTMGLIPYYEQYLVVADSLHEFISLADESSLIQCLSERTKDSVTVVINNPRNIPFSYFVYRKNHQISRGYGKSFTLRQKAANRQSYFVSLQYLWAGEVKTESYKIGETSSRLNIRVEQLAVVYPGQKTEIVVAVTDNGGRPVPGVDLTAFAYTKKFGSSAPELPDLAKTRKDKYLINNFHLTATDKQDHGEISLDYSTWRVLAGLDSIEYYKFLYPGNAIYRYSHPVADSVTQFAPFVVRDGIKPVHVVYVDFMPVYFSWSENAPPYSLPIDSGYHQIRIRTNNKVITIDSLYFPYGQKTIFSLIDTIKDRNVHISTADFKLSPDEFRSLSHYLFPYRNNFKNQITYLKQGNRLQLLSGFGNSRPRLLAGPVMDTYINVKTMEGPEFFFEHEPLMEYEFLPGIIKMRSQAPESLLPKYLGWDAKKSLYDLVWTEERVMQMWQDRKESERMSMAKYTNPGATYPDAGTMQINYVLKDKPSNPPLNTLLLNYTDYNFIRVYPGSARTMYNLEQGYYRLIYFYPGSGYYSVDSLFIQRDGLNYFNIREPDSLTYDPFGKKVNDIIEKAIFQPADYDYNNRNMELEEINRAYRNQFTYNYKGKVIQGYVYEGETSDAIPGVNVIAKGTTYGTVTDMEGYYSITVPPDVTTLVFSFIGFVTDEVDINSGNFRRVELSADVTALREVVVVGYGTQQRSSLTASISTVTFSGSPASKDVSMLQGMA
ncbi:MAG: carboxypeptidase-like regulatory domain-containing protein [Cyclobacteriaceae bacterium]|nr:carboxypeptidase-like regulatory domain-containing protein [Cyclobacteriaceae bacterium]